MSSIKQKKEYDETFPQGTKTVKGMETLREKALRHALDIRKFEIDLYWKRATYFWAFIAASFVGYLSLANSENKTNPETMLLISLLGLSFSVAWYLVNRGSKFWQNNWERHVDLLEDDIIGPLYKTAIDTRTCHFLKLHKEYPFSVSKINQILSIYIISIWVFLTSISISTIFKFNEPMSNFNSLSLITITVVFIGCLLYFGRTEPSEKIKLKDRNIKLLHVRKSFFEIEK